METEAKRVPYERILARSHRLEPPAGKTRGQRLRQGTIILCDSEHEGVARGFIPDGRGGIILVQVPVTKLEPR